MFGLFEFSTAPRSELVPTLLEAFIPDLMKGADGGKENFTEFERDLV